MKQKVLVNEQKKVISAKRGIEHEEEQHEYLLLRDILTCRLSILVFSNLICYLFPRYDQSADLIFSSSSSSSSSSPASSAIVTLLSPLARWDSLHILSIAQDGYQTEQQHAFFPLLPFAIRFGAKILSSAFALIGIAAKEGEAKGREEEMSMLLLSGYLISLLTNCAAVVSLYRLLKQVTSSSSSAAASSSSSSELFLSSSAQQAFMASRWFIFSAASIHLSAIAYTESLFATFVFYGCFCLEQKRRWRAALCFMLASFTRSNGITLILFVAAEFAERFLIELVSFASFFSNSKYFSARFLIVNDSKCLKLNIAEIFCLLVQMILQCLLVVTPYIWYNYTSASTFCPLDSSSSSSSSPTALPSHCDSLLHLSFYSHVQERYWNVGLFRYYSLKQLPQFLIAAPVWLLTLSSLSFSAEIVYKLRSKLLLIAQTQTNDQDAQAQNSKRDNAIADNDSINNRRLKNAANGQHKQENNPITHQHAEVAEEVTMTKKQDFHSSTHSAEELKELKYALHLLVSFVICITVLHVQVSTRFLSSSPLLYLHAMRLCQQEQQEQRNTEEEAETAQELTGKSFQAQQKKIKKSSTHWRLLLTTYSAVYMIVGTILFTTFLPWT